MTDIQTPKFVGSIILKCEIKIPSNGKKIKCKTYEKKIASVMQSHHTQNCFRFHFGIHRLTFSFLRFNAFLFLINLVKAKVSMNIHCIPPAINAIKIF